MHCTGDCGRYSRQIMKILFTPDELSESILFYNPTYAKSGLDSARMNIFKGNAWQHIFHH